MDEPSIQSQVIKTSQEPHRQIKRHRVKDPIRDWLLHKYDQLHIADESPKRSLNKSNASLIALKQRLHVVTNIVCGECRPPGLQIPPPSSWFARKSGNPFGRKLPNSLVLLIPPFFQAGTQFHFRSISNQHKRS